MTTHYCIHPSPLGELLLASDGAALTDLHVLQGKYVPAIESDWQCDPNNVILRQAKHELDAYFDGRLSRFTVALAPRGTPFQCLAWKALCEIPLGETRSYAEQARAMHKPTAVRAVGAANGRNPIAIIIPCHRVIGANGSLVGYAGGLAVKAFLLRHEASSAPRKP